MRRTHVIETKAPAGPVRRGTASGQLLAPAVKAQQAEIRSILRGPGSQAKLAAGTPGDSHEQEAERISQQVMRMPGPEQENAASCACGGECPKCQAGGLDQKLQRLETTHVGSGGFEQAEVPLIVEEVLRSSGQPLEPAVRSFMESRFGHDFSRVRVHADERAAESARAANALAYTVGRDVVFGGGTYRPETSQGRQLLAHELTHVLQQESGHGMGSSASASAASGSHGSLLQMQSEFPWEGFVETEEDPLMLRATPEVSDPPHLNSMDKLAKGTPVTALSGSKFGWMKVRGMTTGGTVKTGFVMGKYIGAGGSIRSSSSTPSAGGTTPTPPISVDSIQIMTSSTGAQTGFSAVVGESDLNRPGPFNDVATEEVTNVHQIHFHLDNGSSANVQPIRRVRATWTYGSGSNVTESKIPEDKPAPSGGGAAVPGGYAGSRYGDDGPGAHEFMRPATDKIVVADPPGVRGLGNWYNPYPLKMEMAFELILWSKIGPPVARVNYSVFIEKKDSANIPNDKNELVPGRKMDLVRDKELP